MVGSHPRSLSAKRVSADIGTTMKRTMIRLIRGRRIGGRFEDMNSQQGRVWHVQPGRYMVTHHVASAFERSKVSANPPKAAL